MQIRHTAEICSLVSVSVTCLLAGFCVAASNGDTADSVLFRKSVSEVVLHIGVLDKKRHTTPMLKAHNIAIFENGSRITHFQSFAREDQLPLRLAILVDNSGSTSRVWQQEQASTSVFLRSLLRTGDVGFVAEFTDTPTVVQDWTSDANAIQTGVMNVRGEFFGKTAIADTLIWASAKFAEQPSTSPTRNVLLIVTDGQETDSVHPMKDAIAAADRADVLVFAIGVGSTYDCNKWDYQAEKPICEDGAERTLMKDLGQRTGGSTYFVDSKKPFASISKKLASELRSFYRVSYTPSNVNDTTYRKLTVQVRGMRHVAIHARDGYSTAALR